jgi:predicted MFS family arabinose efflux permease
MIKAYLKKFQSFNSNLRFLLFSALLVGFTLFGILFALFNIFLLRMGFSTQSIGLVNSAGWISYALICVPSGMLARRIGVKSVIVFGLGLMSISFVFLFVSGFLTTGMLLPFLLLCSIMLKIGFAFYFPNLASALLVYCQPEERNHVFSAEWAIFALGGFLGSLFGGQVIKFLSPLLGVSINNPIPYQCIFLFSALLLVLPIRPLSHLSILQENSISSSNAKISQIPLKNLMLMASIYFLWMVGEQGVGVFFNVFLDRKLGISISSISSLMAAVQLITIPLILIMPLITKRIGNRNTIFFFLLIVSACFIPIAFANSYAPASFFYLVLSSAASIARPTYLLFCQTRVLDEWRPVMSGAVSTTSGLGSAFTSAIGGGLISSMGFSSFFQLCALITALCAGIFGFSFIVHRKNPGLGQD